MQRRARGQGKPSPLDDHAGINLPVPGAPDLTYSLTGGGVDSSDAERVLREVEVDKSVITMSGQYADARRFSLMRDGHVVAAAVVEVQRAPSFSSSAFLEIPILAAARGERKRAYGTVLHALIAEVGAAIGIKIAVVSATPESRRFWLKLGYHSAAFCDPPVAAALRALAQTGVSDGARHPPQTP